MNKYIEMYKKLCFLINNIMYYLELKIISKRKIVGGYVGWYLVLLAVF